MLEYDRIDISERVDVNKTIECNSIEETYYQKDRGDNI